MGLEDCAETLTNFPSNDSIFFVQEIEASILHELKKGLNFFSFYNENVGKYKPNEKLHKNGTGIFYVSKGILKDVFDILFIQDITHHCLYTEINPDGALYFYNQLLSFIREIWSIGGEMIDFISNSWKNIDKYESDNSDK